MNVAVVHNRYGAHSGEETVVESILDLLAAKGHRTSLFTRSSSEIRTMPLGQARAFFSGVFSLSARCAFRRFLHEVRPDVVHIHNLFPLISPAILPECRRARVPVVMSVHNYRLVCPTGLHLSKRDGRLCERCCGGREYWCLLNNCEGSVLKSLGYAVRNTVARKAKFYRANVSIYACLAEFQRRRLISAGFPEERVTVIPNMVRRPGPPAEARRGDYVGFAGRVSPEKGIEVFLSAAMKCPQIPFRIAGNYDPQSGLLQAMPPHCTFLGPLSPGEVSAFYARSRIMVVPSVWYEAFGLCAAEAQAHGKAVLCSRIGSLPEIVVDGETGLLFEAGNVDELAEKIRYLWERPALCQEMGMAGRKRAIHEYSPDQYYGRLMKAYDRAISLGPLCPYPARELLKEEVCCP